jgi:hypothetical protein
MTSDDTLKARVAAELYLDAAYPPFHPTNHYMGDRQHPRQRHERFRTTLALRLFVCVFNNEYCDGSICADALG